jgi:hypothetical protein
MSYIIPENIKVTTLSASSGVTGSFSGSAAGITDITSSNWNGGTSAFIGDVRNQFLAGANISIVDGVISSTATVEANTGSVSDLIVKVKNVNGSNLTKGLIVHITASDNSSDTPGVTAADWTSDYLSANTLGLTYEAIANSLTGSVITEGILTGVSMQHLTTVPPESGQVLYLSSSGQFTNIKPVAPKHIVTIGQIVKVPPSLTNATIFVSIQNGYELNELHDVLVNGTSNGDLLVRDNGLWKNSKVLSSSYEITNNLTASNISASSGIYGRLYGTSSYSLDADKLDGQDSALFALKTDVTGAIANFPVRLEVSGAITGALQPYAKSTDVSSSFTTPLQVSGAISNFSTRTEVSGAITGALGTYAKSTDVTSSFGLKTDLTASYARLAASNTFTENQIIDVSSVNDALRVTQRGSGNVIKIESEANDTTPFVITNTGMVGIRTATPSSALTIAGDVAASGSLTLGNSTSLNHIVSGTLRANNNRLIVDGLTQKVSILGDLNNQSAFFVGNTVNLFNGVYVDSVNNVGIKTSSPSYALDVNGSATVRQDLWVDRNFDVDGNTTLGSGTADNVLINGTVTTNIKMSSGTGIDFSNVLPNTYTDSSILDDYEEGTYTNPGISTSGAATYSSTGTGRYTKVGNLVHYSVRITVTNDSTTENLSVFGVNIPYTAKQIGTSGTTTAYGIVVYKKAASSDDPSFIGTISDTPTRVYLPSNIVVLPNDTTTFEISAVYLAA